MLIPTMSSNYRYYNNASRGEPLHDNTISLGKLLGTGWDGKVYEDKRHSAFVIKVCAETPNIRTELEAEVELFNRYYGENSAALINDTTIRMKKISGIPLDEVEGKIFNERSIERFNEMICNLGDKKIMLK
ncbi:TPA: hypothetical protein ACH0S9_004961, partial [Citrobacter werkmanii]